MKKLLSYCLAAAFFVPFIAMGQNIEECATDRLHQQLLQNDPNYAAKIQSNEALIKHFSKSAQKLKSGTVLEIPVVVHIIHTGEAVGVGSNISDAQINSAIARMNDRYSNAHGPSVDTDIEFVLAKRDPDGNATTGIIRVDGSSVGGYDTAGINAGGSVGADEQTIKNLSRWPNTNYYNIWVVNEIEDNDGLFGIQGYAYFPGASPTIDGTIIMHTCFGTIGTVNSFNNEGRTLVHELGHGLNLYHTFEGDAGGTTCPTGSGDEVADTDPHIRAASNCPTGTNSCTGNSIDGVTSNFMNYSSQTCALEFTSGQSTRMRAAILASRPNLTTSLGGTAPSGSYVGSPSCIPVTSNTNNGFGMGIYQFTLNNVDVVSDGAVNEGGYIDHSRHQTINLDIDSMYSIYVGTGSANNEDIEVYIDWNGDGDFNDSLENVFSSSNNISHSGSITVPSFASTGLTRLRVMGDWFNFTISGPCYNPTYGQTEDYAVMISQATSPLSVTVTTTDALCNGGATGSATANVSGGTNPYTYLWSTSSTASSINNLAAGNYGITVSDALGATAISSFVISSPNALNSTAQTWKHDSCSASVGGISSTVFGGVPAYHFLWSSGDTTQTVYNVSVGTYTVTVTDANGCISTSFTQVNNDTSSCASAIPAPTNLIERKLAQTSARLMWDTVSGVNGYRVQYREVGALTWNDEYKYFNFGLVDIAGLTANTTYIWRVQAKGSSSWGPFSSNKQFTTLSSACNGASAYSMDLLLSDRAQMAWTPSPQAVRQKIRYRQQGSPTWTQNLIGATRSAYRIIGLSPSTTYEWQINTVCDLSTAGKWGPIQTFTTLAFNPLFRMYGESDTEPNKWDVLSIYPNPTSEDVWVQMPARTSQTQIQIVDLQGKLVFQKDLGINSSSELLKLEINHLSSGVYLIQFRDADSKHQEKLMIQ